jgi:N-methylhydantoinase B/oxoprolinase/acetone carboxylase alpha subunit
MRWLEIIHLRLAGKNPGALVDAIRKTVDSGTDSMEVRIYRHAKLETDLIVHLHRNAAGGTENTSDLGARLASVLREYGMVEHSVWQELG